MSVVNTNGSLQAIDARFRNLFFESAGSIPMISQDIMLNPSTERRYEQFSRWYGTDEAPVVDEGAAYTSKEIALTATKTTNVKKFGFVINVTRELIMDNEFSPIADDVAKAMRNSMAQTKEKRALNLLNNGFTTQLVYDGLSLFNVAHPLGQGGTQANQSSTDSALDLDSYWSGINTMMTTKGNSSLNDVIYEPRYLVVPQGLERRANELIKSEWVPQVTENTANVVNDLYKVQAKKSPFFTSSTAWFLIANPSQVVEFGLIILQREPLSINALFDVKGDSELGLSIDKDIYSWRVRERYECDTPKTWFGLYGNKGAA